MHHLQNICIEDNYDGVEIVSSHKHLKCLQYAIEHHHPLPPSLFLHAVYGGDLEIIECLFSTGRYKPLSKHLCISISTNQIHVVKYLVERLGYTVNLTHLIAAVESDLPYIYEYLLTCFELIPNDKDWIDTVYRACENTDLHLLKWAYETLAPKPVYWVIS